MKKTHLSVKPININGKPFWQLTIPKPGVGRERKTYKSKAEAKQALREAQIRLDNAGPLDATMNDLLRAHALEAHRLLQPYNANILDVVKAYVASRELADKSCTVAFAVQDFIAARQREGNSKRYIEDLRSRLGKFSLTFGETKVATVTAEQIDNWIHGFKWSPVTRNIVRRRIGTMFAHCVGRKWCAGNPVEDVGVSKEVDEPIGILTPNQFARLLETATEETLPYFLIGGFAGVRSAELNRLEWHDIHFHSGLIEIRSKIAKSAQRRLVPMQPCLVQWLAPFQGRTGKVAPSNSQRKLNQVKATAGIMPWPKNALRHSFASYHLARFENAGQTAHQLGHQSAALLYEHYRELVGSEAAAVWFSILPQSSGNVVPISA